MDLEVLTVQVLLGEGQRPVTSEKRKNFVTRACTHVVDDGLGKRYHTSKSDSVMLRNLSVYAISGSK